MQVGDELPERTFRIRLGDLVRYCGAGGDFNPIHWDRRAARAAGLPDVIAHGMYTMALAGRFLTEWAGDPGAVESFDVRFSAPVVVDDETGAEITISGTVTGVRPDGRAEVLLTALSGGVPVLKDARALLRPPLR